MAAFSWSEAQFNTGNNDREKLSDVVDMVEFPKGKYGSYRFIGAPRPTAMHWVTTLTKPKEGQKSKIVSFPKVCLGFDPDTMNVDTSKCPYCQLDLTPRVEVRQNVIDRNLQENMPRRVAPLQGSERRLVEWNGGKFHIKAGKDTGGWTPVRVLNVVPSIGKDVKEMASLNRKTVKGKKREFGPDHPRYGFDVMIKYNKEEKTPSDIYKNQKGEASSLSEEELGYAIWDIPEHAPEDEATARKEAARMKPYLCNRKGELLFPEAAAEAKKGGKKRNQYKDEFDEDEDLEDDDDTTSRKSKSRSRKSNWDDEDEDDDDNAPFDIDDNEDDEEEERPRRKSSKTKDRRNKKSGSGKIKVRVKSRRHAMTLRKVSVPKLNLKRRSR